MGTVDPEPETAPGYIQRAGHSANILRETASEVAYGRRSGSLWPLILILTAILLILVLPLAALIPIVLLGAWVGGQGR